MIAGVDVSHHQLPEKFDWPALAAKYEFLVARACYGSGTADRQFVKFCAKAREHGMKFGAYLFYRQTQSVEGQLALFDKQLSLVGGLVPGDLFPVLDMEHNAINGDGQVNAALFSESCRRIAESWREHYGGAILYYSSLFPQFLKVVSQPGLSSWMRVPGLYHWLANYGPPPGQPSHPYTPVWHLHQHAGKGRIPEYAAGSVDIDLDVARPDLADLDELRIRVDPRSDVSDEARDGECDTDDRPGGADPFDLDTFDAGAELMREGAAKLLQGIEKLAGIKK